MTLQKPLTVLPDLEKLRALIAQGRVPPDIGLTIGGRGDGAGAQAMARVSAMVAARVAGVRYMHAPFALMQHAPSARDVWAAQWERFLGLGVGETEVPADARFMKLDKFAAGPPVDPERIVIWRPGYRLPRKVAAPILDALRPKLRAAYRLHDKSAIPVHCGPDGTLTVAVHLRRGDVAKLAPHRYVSDAFMLRSIALLRQALEPLGRPHVINLYSEGDASAFAVFTDCGCRLFLDIDPFETFHNLVQADILLTGLSSFSRLAGLLSEGIVIPCEVPALHLTRWVRRDSRKGDVSIRRVHRAFMA